MLAAKNIKIVIAAGNGPEGKKGEWVQMTAPANAGGATAPANAGGANNVYTISAIDEFWPPGGNNSFADFSNFGDRPPDYAEPGVDIESLWLDGKANRCSGTSFAAAHFTGLLARGEPLTNDGFAKKDPVLDDTNQGDPIRVLMTRSASCGS